LLRILEAADFTSQHTGPRDLISEVLISPLGSPGCNWIIQRWAERFPKVSDLVRDLGDAWPKQ
jgi:hypothetical protein